MADFKPEVEAWLRQTVPRAVAYARSLLDRPSRAEDIVQDVVCRLLDHEEYDLRRNGDALLFRSVTNACINAATRRKSVRSLDREDDEGRSLYSDLSAGGAEDAPDRLEARDLLDAVGRELRDLPPRQRAAVELKAMGRTLRQIAETLEVSPGNAGVLVHRGRRKLKERLGQQLPRQLR
ncbi:MAG: RNA polymerase sigma factor [Planctomycetota bacterium]